MIFHRFFLFLLFVLAAAGGIVYAGWRWVRPRARPDPDLDSAAREVYFRTQDGVLLRGVWLEGQQDYPGVVVCHGYFRSIAEPYQVALWLWESGYNVLLFDFRGCGRSQPEFTTLGAKEMLDVLAAVDWLKQQVSGPIGVYGISMGAVSALMAATRSFDIAALVLDSPYSRLDTVVEQRIRSLFRMPWLLPLGYLGLRAGELISRNRVSEIRPIDYIATLSPRPIFIVYGDEDTLVPPSHARELYELAVGEKEIWVARGSRHAMARHDYPEEYRQRLLDFLERHLLQTTGSASARSS
ncbi:MAG TPA: alpha/beta fold hydrolase [Dehalococcoidia bacterium]|nr:alpha/beta fold hydrolase [Dehalococcoidia bacterium]